MNARFARIMFILLVSSWVVASCAQQNLVNPRFNPSEFRGKQIAMFSDGYFVYCGADDTVEIDLAESTEANQNLLAKSSKLLQSKGYAVSAAIPAFVAGTQRKDKPIRLKSDSRFPHFINPPIVTGAPLKEDAEYREALQSMFQALAATRGFDAPFPLFRQHPGITEASLVVRKKSGGDFGVFVLSEQRRDTMGRIMAGPFANKRPCVLRRYSAYVVDLASAELLWMEVIQGEVTILLDRLDSVPR